MIISHKYRFIFIKTAKTAGTSLEVFLSGVCGEDDVVTPIEPYVSPHRARNYKTNGFYNHMAGADIRERIEPEIWDNYFKFCVERNPWDKTVSHYFMERFRADRSLTLEDYFERGRFCSSFGLYANSAGSLLVDHVARYEKLSAELGDIFSSLNVPFDGELSIRAKSEHRTDRRHYREILNNQQKEQVAKQFAREIATFGYAF